METQDHSLPRITPVTQPDADTAETLNRTLIGTEVDGPLNVFKTLAQHPALLKRFNVLGGFFLTKGLLDPAVREVSILRTAFLSGSEYEWLQHAQVANRVGIDSETINALREASPRVAPEILDLTVRITDQIYSSGDLDDSLFTEGRDSFGEAGLIELLMLCGFYRMLANVLVTLRVQGDVAHSNMRSSSSTGQPTKGGQEL